VTCGRPLARTVEIQNSSADSRTSTTSSQGVGVTPGALKPACNSGVGAGDDITDLPGQSSSAVYAPVQKSWMTAGGGNGPAKASVLSRTPTSALAGSFDHTLPKPPAQP
jgi:hypothetical protein